MARTQICSETVWASLANFTQLNNVWGAVMSFNSSTQVGVGVGSTVVGCANVVWSGTGTFNGQDQYCKITIGALTTLSTDYVVGVSVRTSNDVRNNSTDTERDMLAVLIGSVAGSGGSNPTTLWKWVNGTNTQIATTNTTWTNGDTLALEADGISSATNIRVYKNDVEITALTQTGYNSQLSTGKPGFLGSDTLTIDNFEGGDVTIVAVPPPINPAAARPIVAVLSASNR